MLLIPTYVLHPRPRYSKYKKVHISMSNPLLFSNLGFKLGSNVLCFLTWHLCSPPSCNIEENVGGVQHHNSNLEFGVQSRLNRLCFIYTCLSFQSGLFRSPPSWDNEEHIGGPQHPKLEFRVRSRLHRLYFKSRNSNSTPYRDIKKQVFQKNSTLYHRELKLIIGFGKGSMNFHTNYRGYHFSGQFFMTF